MSILKTAKDLGELGLPSPYGTLAALAETTYDLGAGAWDLATGDPHASDHFGDAVIDGLSMLPGLDKVLGLYGVAKDIQEDVGPSDEPAPTSDDDGGMGAGLGAMIGMGFGGLPLAIPGLILGGVVGSNLTPKIGPAGVSPDLGAMAGTIAATGMLPYETTDTSEAPLCLPDGPFDHWAE